MPRRPLLALSLALLGWALPSLAAAQASLVRDVNPAPADGSSNSSIFINNFLSLGPRAVFFVSRRTGDLTSFELWTTDGTDAGTERILELPEGSGPGFLASNGRLAFFSSGSSFVPEMDLALWRTDGTREGTFRLVSGLGFSPESAFVGGSLVFSACQIVQGAFRCEPWVSEGTVAGTRRLRDITPGEYGSNPRSFVTVGGLVYFFADAPDGTGLWRTDGTPEGWELLPPGNRVEIAADLAVFGGRLYFMGLDFVDLTRNEGVPTLFRSDGTAAGTVLVRDVRPGPAPSQIGTMAPGGDRVFFSADDGDVGAHGVELWTSDGTPAGTRLAADVSEGPRSSFPQEIVRIGDRVFFSADDGIAGREPWVLPLTSTLTGRIVP